VSLSFLASNILLLNPNSVRQRKASRGGGRKKNPGTAKHGGVEEEIGRKRVIAVRFIACRWWD